MTAVLRSSVLRGQGGAGAVELVLAVAFLIIPVALLLMSLPILAEYRSMGDAAAREAVRACAVASDPRSGQETSERVARQIITERGLAPEGTTIDIDCAVAWRPGGVVTAAVVFEVPAIHIVGIGEIGSITISRSYVERIEAHRSEPRR